MDSSLIWSALQGAAFGCLLLVGFCVVAGVNPVKMLFQNGWARLTLVSCAVMGAGATLWLQHTTG